MTPEEIIRARIYEPDDLPRSRAWDNAGVWCAGLIALAAVFLFAAGVWIGMEAVL